MRLEVITRRPRRKRRGPAILFVHGSGHGAWCWDEHFLGFFANNGFDVTAISLRGHGASEGRGSLRWTKVSRFVDDIHSIVATRPEPPVLVGHSLGGYIVQRYLEERELAGAVLLASSPARGMFIQGLRLVFFHPYLFAKVMLFLDPGRLFETPEQVRMLLFASTLDRELLARYASRLGAESFRAMLEMAYRRPRVSRIRDRDCPLLVLGAERDVIVQPSEVEATAKAYGVNCQIFPGMGHDMMLEGEWMDVAEAIRSWMETTFASDYR